MEEKFYLRRMIDLTKTWEVVGDAEKKKRCNETPIRQLPRLL